MSGVRVSYHPPSNPLIYILTLVVMFIMVINMITLKIVVFVFVSVKFFS